MSTPELLPCPFCRGDAVAVSCGGGLPFVVECSVCSCRLSAPNERESPEKWSDRWGTLWNTRPKEEELQDEIDNLQSETEGAVYAANQRAHEADLSAQRARSDAAETEERARAERYRHDMANRKREDDDRWARVTGRRVLK